MSYTCLSNQYRTGHIFPPMADVTCPMIMRKWSQGRSRCPLYSASPASTILTSTLSASPPTCPHYAHSKSSNWLTWLTTQYTNLMATWWCVAILPLTLASQQAKPAGGGMHSLLASHSQLMKGKPGLLDHHRGAREAKQSSKGRVNCQEEPWRPVCINTKIKRLEVQVRGLVLRKRVVALEANFQSRVVR